VLLVGCTVVPLVAAPRTPIVERPPVVSLTSPTLEWHQDLNAAIRRASGEGKPILVRVVASYCPWCTKLEKEMADPAVQKELDRWTLVELNQQRLPQEAAHLGSGAVPAIRVLTPAGLWVAGREGFLKAADLVLWLGAQYEAAMVAPDAVLHGTEAPDGPTVERLVTQFRARTAAVREASVRRLLAHPGAARQAVARAFADGNLATRLAALELLQAWHAPVAEIDPWQPDTVTAERVAGLQRWAATVKTIVAQPFDAEQRAAALREIDRMLPGTTAEAEAAIERLARYREALLPEVTERLRRAATDQDRQRLLMLRYRLVASDGLALSWPGGLARLASTEAATRRKAAEELPQRATSADQPLLLELFSDPDPLVRELALRGLQQIGGADATNALVKLLEDPEPNVRAAVLKQLAASPAPTLLPHVIRYVGKERDPDLVVHAIRVLRETKGKGVQQCLITLLDHPQWQVRAEAAEALGKVTGANRVYAEKPDPARAEAYAALLQRLNDNDGFVVARAVQGLEDVDLEIAVDPLVKAALRYPQLAPKILTMFAHGQVMRKKALPHLKEFVKHGDPNVRAAAVAGLSNALKSDAGQWLLEGLKDTADPVRRAAAKSLFSVLEDRRREAAGQLLRFESPLSLEQKAPESLFGKLLSGLGEALSGRPASVTPAAKPAPQAKTTTDSRGEIWDTWLTDSYAGRGRPKWTSACVGLLEAMLGSRAVETRFEAARTLVALGANEKSLPVLVEAIGREAGLSARAAAVLPWLVWQQRWPAFVAMDAKAKEDSRFELLQTLSEVPDERAFAPLWRLLAEPRLTQPKADAVITALLRVYLGTSYAWSEKRPASLVRKMLEAARLHAERGTTRERLAGLVLLYHGDRGEASQAAARTAADVKLDKDLQNDAFQIRLAAEPATAQTKLAVAGLGERDSRRRELALACLVGDDHRLFWLHGRLQLSRSSTFESSRQSGQPIVPQAPSGLKPAMVRPLLDHSDSELAGQAGYLLALLGERDGLPALLRLWRERGEKDDRVQRLVYRAIAALDDSSQLPVLKTIYSRLDPWEMGEFYWTIRIMTGSAMLQFRKQIRDEVGVSNLH
jgi:HEAT repeat protein